MIIDKTQTLLIQPECIATVLSRHVVIDIADEKVPEASADSITPRVVDPVLLSVFGHRFMSIAEQVYIRNNPFLRSQLLTTDDMTDGPHIAEDVCISCYQGETRFQLRII